MKNRIKLFLMSGLMLLMLVSFAVPAGARDTSYSLTLNCFASENNNTKAVSGDTFAVVKIADASINKTENKNNPVFTTVSNFKNDDCAWAELSSSDLRSKAKKLASTVTKQDYVDIQKTDKNGYACFNLDDAGMYLVLRTETANANISYEPSLISVPQIVDGEVIPHVQSTPKLSDNKNKQITTTLDNDNNNDNNNSTLPQTGQMNLPVVIFAVLGVILTAAGAYLVLRSKNEKDE